MGTPSHAAAYRRMLRRLRQARLDAGWSQVRVADALGITQSAISKMERGERRIDPVELARFAELYGRDVRDFLDDG